MPMKRAWDERGVCDGCEQQGVFRLLLLCDRCDEEITRPEEGSVRFDAEGHIVGLAHKKCCDSEPNDEATDAAHSWDLGIFVCELNEALGDAVGWYRQVQWETQERDRLPDEISLPWH